MKLEKNSNSMLFSSTEIPDVFFTEYMSQANGDFIKVYLCLLFLSKYDKDINLNDLSKKLDIFSCSSIGGKIYGNSFNFCQLVSHVLTLIPVDNASKTP